MFVDNNAVEGDQQASPIYETEADSNADDLPTLEDIIDGEVANILSLAAAEKDELDDECISGEDSGSDYEDGSSYSSDDNDEQADLQANRTISAKKSTKKPRKTVAKDAREYVARLRKEEDRKYALRTQHGSNRLGTKRSRKRKLTESNAESCKVLKTANGSSLLTSEACSSVSDGHPLLPMEPIKARTHAEQFAQIQASIPQGYDTRRKITQSQDLKEAAKVFGYKKVEALDGDWKLKGMETAMRSHQITAVAWMVKRELAPMEPFGGILADAMGMGKTIMSLACIIGNPADDEHIKKFCKTTLVVVPSKTIALQIATYKELITQYPDNKILKTLDEKYGSDDISYKRELDKIVGTLFRINWYRIILDEAHAIKNAESRTAKACCALLGKYRWALSGTPLANSSDGMGCNPKTMAWVSLF
ncbi:hypothetical protein Trco_007086 [Trichoderma cornu-damae]|uniref:Helicase ATP-binding domain-containing protein n=1 Tax=Trichoderma cornu-damae TaxID=654480 RepID=A0A9P8TVM0_9HYPO|nr:hypothetical protein Trco_007086 [Trichoderma cornu-damae]